MLAGCGGTLQTRAVLHDPAMDAKRQVELVEVPFYPQEDYQCGPAALAMVLTAVGVNTDPQTLQPEVYLPERKGSLQVEMLATARRHGVVAYQLQPELRDVLAEVGAGNPVIVLQNLGLSWYPVWHYAVVIGYDLNSEELILRSGREQRQRMSLSTFERTWARGNYWAMVAMPGDKLPRTAEEPRYIAAVSALEKMGQVQLARNAYQSAVQRWPDSLGARIGLGNVSYRMGELAQAAEHFKLAVDQHPDSVAALNNLAQTLSDLGRHEEALIYARRAVDLGGPLHTLAQATLGEITLKLAR